MSGGLVYIAIDVLEIVAILWNDLTGYYISESVGSVPTYV